MRDNPAQNRQYLPLEGGVSISWIELEHLRNMDIERYDENQIVDLKAVSIDRSLPVCERLSSLWAQVKNPYLFRVDDIVVKVEFSSGRSLESALLSFLLGEKSR